MSQGLHNGIIQCLSISKSGKQITVTQILDGEALRSLACGIIVYGKTTDLRHECLLVSEPVVSMFACRERQREQVFVIVMEAAETHFPSILGPIIAI